jgi:hypothetical protein
MFDAGNEAHAAGADIHARYKRKRLPHKHMLLLHTKGGFDELKSHHAAATVQAETSSV